jgi:hypothetical protein
MMLRRVVNDETVRFLSYLANVGTCGCAGAKLGAAGSKGCCC